MPKYSSKEFKTLIKDGKKENNTVSIEDSFFFIDVNKTTGKVLPTAVITTAGQEEILLQYNSSADTYSITTPPASLNFQKINDSAKQVKNHAIKNFVDGINASSKGKFVSGQSEIDDLSESQLSDIFNAIEESDSGIPIYESLEIIDGELKQILQSEVSKQKQKEKKQKEKSSMSQQKTSISQQKTSFKPQEVMVKSPSEMFEGSILEDDYPEFVRQRTLQLNKQMDEKLRKLQYDRKNDIQKEISERFGEGQSVMLMGDTGIGKTFNPEYIAKENGMSTMTVKLHRASDSVELLGKPSFRANAFTGEQEMYFDSGFLTNAFRQASKNAQNNEKGFVLILDEMLRVEDMTPFISNLSVNGNDEYVLSIDESNSFAKIETNIGEQWFHISDDIDRDKQSYQIDNNGIISMLENSNPQYFFNGDTEQAAERHFRGDLLSIHREDFKEVLNKNKRLIVETHSEKTKIFTPARAISIVATTNIGENYEVNMGNDNALLSRFNPVPLVAPKISYMTNKTVEKIAESKNWTEAEQKHIKKVITTFSTGITKVLKNNKNIENPQKINFRILNDIVSGVTPTKPFANGQWSLENVLKRSAIKFLSVDTSLSADEIRQDPILETVMRSAEQAIELSGNPAFKGIKEELLEQEEQLVHHEEEDEPTTGMKI